MFYSNNSYPLSQQGPRYQTIPTNEVDLNVTENHVMNQMTNHHGKINKWKYFLVAFGLSALLVMFIFLRGGSFESNGIFGNSDASSKYESVTSYKGSSSEILEASDNYPILNGPYCVKTNGAPPTKQFNCLVLKEINTTFIKKLPDTDATLINLINPATNLSDIYAQAIRLAFHDAGEVDLTDPFDQLGSDGCLSASPDSKGIIESTSYVHTLIEPLWQNYCEYLTRADFWALIGKLAVESSAKPVGIIPGGYITIPYQYGRKDNKQCPLTNARLPDGQEGYHGPNGLEEVFIKRMGLSWDDIVTLSGAHTVGRVHIKNSGYGISESDTFGQNAWDTTPANFDNQYFAELNNQGPRLLKSAWAAKLPNPMIEKDPNTKKNLWAFDNIFASFLVMLNSDMALAFDFTQESNFQASNTKCDEPSSPQKYQTCIVKKEKKSEPAVPVCMNPKSTKIPITYPLVAEYANDNQKFLNAFAIAYDKMTSVGYSTDPNKPGKLGTLKYLTCV